MSITLMILAITLTTLEAGDVAVAVALAILAMVNSASAANGPPFYRRYWFSGFY